MLGRCCPNYFDCSKVSILTGDGVGTQLINLIILRIKNKLMHVMHVVIHVVNHVVNHEFV